MTQYITPGPTGIREYDYSLNTKPLPEGCILRDGIGWGQQPGHLGSRIHNPILFREDNSLKEASIEEKAQALLTAPAATFSPGEAIRGTVFMGGAGMNGGYISDMARAFSRKGIRLIQANPKKWSGGTLMDAVIGVDAFRSGKSQIQVLLERFPPHGNQFNLIGYSYGSLAVSQVAINYAEAGTKIDHLILIGSPIGSGFLHQLQKHANIKSVIVVDLTPQGDPIFAGISRDKLLTSAPELGKQMLDSSGHFYYAPNSEDGKKRRDALADYLYSKGLR
ncbi:hypothetical protein [Acidovorax sp. NCPPB 4044]|uniref:hypothetical protein n=1 Tax=Acidovorax sp. NCPPB 4044 TaxID=2940490 RepID=UPI002304020B|nr:hypothetical protein [Acidovorax sp. NCPPB 4044]MDA8519608.1 hypothetical protein [Acidovorax sp. NCPPB 4044]